jgi:hypothetical protein
VQAPEPIVTAPVPPQPAPEPAQPSWTADPVSPAHAGMPAADPEPDLRLGGEPADEEGAAQTEPPTAADSQIAAELQFAPEAQFASEPGFAPEPQFASELQFEPEAQFAPEPGFAPEPQFAPEPVIGPEPQIAHEPFVAQPLVELEPEPVAQEMAPEPVDHVFAERGIVVEPPLDDQQPLYVGGLGEAPDAVHPEPDPNGEEAATPAVVAAANGGSEELAATLGGDIEDPNLRLAAAAGRPVVAMRRREEAIGSIVDCRVQPVGSLRVDPLALGPYRFPSAASADEFVDETMRALEYLGCDLE